MFQEIRNWMDEATSGFVYFTLGSMIRIETLPRNVLDAFYETLKNIAPVKVLLKIAKVEDLPPGLPSNVMTQPWFPQVKIFSNDRKQKFLPRIIGLFYSAQKYQTGCDSWRPAFHN